MGWAIKITKSGNQRDGDMVSFATSDADMFDFDRFVQLNGGINIKKLEFIRTRPEDAARLLFEKAQARER